MNPTRPIVRYFGGKWELAPWIISRFPPHRVYVEPFGGGGSVLLSKPRAHLEVYGDLDGEMVNLFQVLRNPVLAVELERACRLTPFARAEFDLAYEQTNDPVEGARRTLVRAIFGHGSTAIQKRVGFRAQSRATHLPPPRDWVNYPNHVKSFTDRLKGVVIENRDALDVMRQHDHPDCLHFVDPPYVFATRESKNVYRHEMDDESHAKLCDFLSSLGGMVILCGYPNSIYDRLGWRTVSTETLADGNGKRTETLWINPKADSMNTQLSMFGGAP